MNAMFPLKDHLLNQNIQLLKMVSHTHNHHPHITTAHTVHCRRRHSDRGRLKDPSTSSNVYWQFEKDSDPRSGEPLYWGERVRIKHLPTRLYLTVTQQSEQGYTVRSIY